jgi:hypothetical protein
MRYIGSARELPQSYLIVGREDVKCSPAKSPEHLIYQIGVFEQASKADDFLQHSVVEREVSNNLLQLAVVLLERSMRRGTWINRKHPVRLSITHNSRCCLRWVFLDKT